MKFKQLYSNKINFVWGLDSNNKKAHFFVLSPQYKTLMLSKNTNAFSAANYGNVIASGFGFFPSFETLVMLKNKYGYEFITPPELKYQA